MKKTRNNPADTPIVDGFVERPNDSVSLDVLCRRAERLIDSVRMMGEQVDRMFSRPNQAIAEANEAAKSLLELRGQIEEKLAEARQTEQSIVGRTDEVRSLMPSIEQSAQGLIQRVLRARELTDAFGKLMDTAAEKVAQVESAAGEARKAREAIATAMAELCRVQKAADNWAGSVNGLTAKYGELIAAGNSGAQRLRTLTDAGERLRESVREDIVALRELLRESRVERIAWEQLLSRMPAGLITAKPTAAVEVPQAAEQSVPAALAGRVRKLADLVRQSAATPAEHEKKAVPPTASRLTTPAAQELVKNARD